MKQPDIRAAILDFVAAELLDGDANDLDERTPLLELGIIDSMSIVSLIMFVEEHCRVAIPSEMVRPEDFKDVASIAALVARLRKSEAS